jgi:hypothetical protein
MKHWLMAEDLKKGMDFQLIEERRETFKIKLRIKVYHFLRKMFNLMIVIENLLHRI